MMSLSLVRKARGSSYLVGVLSILMANVAPASPLGLGSIPNAANARFERAFKILSDQGITLLDQEKKPIAQGELNRIGNHFFLETRDTAEFPHRVLFQIRTHHSVRTHSLVYSIEARDRRTDRFLSQRALSFNYSQTDPEEMMTAVHGATESMSDEIETAYLEARVSPGSAKGLLRTMNQVFGLPFAYAAGPERFLQKATSACLGVAMVCGLLMFLVALSMTKGPSNPSVDGLFVAVPVLIGGVALVSAGAFKLTDVILNGFDRY